MELPDNRGERMGPGRSAEEIVGFMECSGPIAECLIHRVFKCSGSGINGYDFRVHQLHTEDIWLLSRDVFCSHIDHALEPQESTSECGGGAVLARSRLRNDASLSHTFSQEGLSEDLVRLMCTTVYEVLTLEKDPCLAA